MRVTKSRSPLSIFREGARTLLVVQFCTSACGRDHHIRPVPSLKVAIENLSHTIAAEGHLRALNATPIGAPEVSGGPGRMRIAWLAPEGERVRAGQVVVKFDPTQLRQKLADSQSAHATASAELEKERLSIRTAAQERNVAARLASLELEKTRRFRPKDSVIYSRNELIEAEVDETLSKARRAHAEAAQKVGRGLSRSTIELAEAKQRQAALHIEHASAGLSALEARAPHDGLFVLRRDRWGDPPRVGETVWPGQRVAEIPDLKQMEAEVFVLEVDARGLRVGTPVILVVESMPNREFSGTVVHVDDLAKRRVRAVPVQYFAAVVKLKETDPQVMKPGQRVRARIEVASQRGIVVPRSAVFVVLDKDTVFVRTPTGWTARQVVLGAASVGRVVVTEGLEDGEEIALTDPR